MGKLLIERDSLVSIADGFRASRKITESLTLDQMATLAAVPTGGLETAITEYNQVNSQAAAYLNAAKSYTNTDNQANTVMSNYLSTNSEYDDPLGQTIPITEKGTLFMVDETDGSTVAETVSAGSKTIYNLIPGHIYQWFVKNSGGAVTASGRLKPTGSLRMIKFLYSGIRNFRDLGGWTCDGGTVKYGLLIRGGFAGDSEIDAENKKLAKYVGIKHDVDLRNEATTKVSPFGSDVRYTNTPITAYYVSIINGSDATSYTNAVKALRTIMDAVIYGDTCYFHCSLGADRCGTIAWMIESLLGVPNAEKDKDYELTTFYVYQAQSETRYRTRSDYKALYTYINSLSGSTFTDKIVRWYLNAGFSIEELNAFRKAAIDGTPSTLTAPAVTYSVTNTLTQCTTNNSATSALENTSYSATITANSGYALDSVTVKMGGVDITSTSVSGGKITIASVTGNIVITAKAIAVAKYTNQLPLAIDTSGAVYNGKGWKDSTRLSSGGGDSSANGMSTSGYIPCRLGDVIRLQGINHKPTGNSNYRVILYTESFAVVTGDLIQGGKPDVYQAIESVTDTNGYLTQFKINAYNDADFTTVRYFRICGDTFSSNAIITVNEKIV